MQIVLFNGCRMVVLNDQTKYSDYRPYFQLLLNRISFQELLQVGPVLQEAAFDDNWSRFFQTVCHSCCQASMSVVTELKTLDNQGKLSTASSFF